MADRRHGQVCGGQLRAQSGERIPEFPTFSARSDSLRSLVPASRASTSRDVTIEVDLSAQSEAGASQPAPDAAPSDTAAGTSAGRPAQKDGSTSVSRVRVPPLTAKAINGPEGCGVESSFVVNTGEGLAWTMDWSPVNERDGSSLLAVGCHPPGSSDSLHELTELCTRKDAVIQIWKVSGAGRESDVEPLVNLVHEGGVTWSVCWCPSRRSFNGRLGLLAAVLGDGTVCIWDVPELSPPGSDGQPHLTCRAKPVAEVGPCAVDGSIPCTVDWLPHAPHDMLLVGYRDGCVSIVQLTDCTEPGSRMDVKQYFPAEALTLTAARWFPAELHEGHEDVDNGAERRTFVTCGHESSINIWDTRAEFAPKLSVKTACAYSIQDIAFSKEPLGISVAMEDGTVRGLLLGAADISAQLKSGRPLSLLQFKGLLRGGLWAIDASVPSELSKPGQQSIAFAGEDGIVGVMGNASYPYVAKKRKDHDTPLLRLEVSGDSESTFKLSSGEKVPPGTLYSGSDPKKASDSTAPGLVKDAIPNAAHTIYCLRWSKPCGSAARGQWLAYGNASGIIHVVWVKAAQADAEDTPAPKQKRGRKKQEGGGMNDGDKGANTSTAKTTTKAGTKTKTTKNTKTTKTINTSNQTDTEEQVQASKDDGADSEATEDEVSGCE